MSGILSWIHSVFTSGVDDVKKVIDAVDHALSVVWSTLASSFADVKKAWAEMVNGAKALAESVDAMAKSYYAFCFHMVKKAIPAVTAWAVREFDHAKKALETGLGDLRKWAETALKGAEKWAKDAVAYVEKNLIDPLKRDLAGAVAWIAREGTTAYNLVTHPEKLAALLLAPLWKAAIDLLHSQEHAVAAFLVHGIYAAMLKTADVAEQIFTDLV